MNTNVDKPANLRTTKILIVEGSAHDAQLLMLLLNDDPEWSVTIAATLKRGKSYLGQTPFDLVLADLSLSDAAGIEIIHELHGVARNVPLIAMSSRQDEKLAMRALREGAQDYLVKGETDRSLLLRVVRYAQERHRLVAALQSMALMDTLTGLYNRRGFVTVAEEQMKLARRTSSSFALAFVDLDGMKRINDTLGHEFGDQALVTPRASLSPPLGTQISLRASAGMSLSCWPLQRRSALSDASASVSIGRCST